MQSAAHFPTCGNFVRRLNARTCMNSFSLAFAQGVHVLSTSCPPEAHVRPRAPAYASHTYGIDLSRGSDAAPHADHVTNARIAPDPRTWPPITANAGNSRAQTLWVVVERTRSFAAYTHLDVPNSRYGDDPPRIVILGFLSAPERRPRGNRVRRSPSRHGLRGARRTRHRRGRCARGRLRTATRLRPPRTTPCDLRGCG